MVKRGLKVLCLNVFHCAILGGVSDLPTIQCWNSTTSCASFHVSFKEIPLSCSISFPPCTETRCVQASSAESSRSARDVLFPERRSHQPPTEPHTPHGPRLPGTEMLLEQMYRNSHITHTQTHSTNTHTRQSISHMPICKPAAVDSAAKSVSSFNSLPKALICNFPQLVDFQHQHLSITLMSCLPWKSFSPEAEVNVKPPQTIREQMANTANLQFYKKRKYFQCFWTGLVLT